LGKDISWFLVEFSIIFGYYLWAQLVKMYPNSSRISL